MFIGGHGYHSVNAKFESENIQQKEVNNSYKFLSSKIFCKKDFDFLYSYPNGGFTKYTQELLKKLNCEIALTTLRKSYNDEFKLEVPRLDGPHDFSFIIN